MFYGKIKHCWAFQFFTEELVQIKRTSSFKTTHLPLESVQQSTFVGTQTLTLNLKLGHLHNIREPSAVAQLTNLRFSPAPISTTIKA